MAQLGLPSCASAQNSSKTLLHSINQDYMNQQHGLTLQTCKKTYTYKHTQYTCSTLRQFKQWLLFSTYIVFVYTLVYMVKDTRMVKIYKQICKYLFFTENKHETVYF